MTSRHFYAQVERFTNKRTSKLTIAQPTNIRRLKYSSHLFHLPFSKSSLLRLRVPKLLIWLTSVNLLNGLTLITLNYHPWRCATVPLRDSKALLSKWTTERGSLWEIKSSLWDFETKRIWLKSFLYNFQLIKNRMACSGNLGKIALGQMKNVEIALSTPRQSFYIFLLTLSNYSQIALQPMR